MFLLHIVRIAVPMQAWRHRIKAMHEIEVVLWCQRLLSFYNDQLIFENSIPQCRESLIVDIVQIHALHGRTELPNCQTRSILWRFS